MKYFHMGTVVDDIDEAVSSYTALGLSFTRTRHVVTSYDVRGVLTEVELLVSYSIEEPHLELVQELRGGVWDSPSGRLHHLGIWSDDVAADVERYRSAGFTPVLSTPTSVRPEPLVTYMINADGLHIELLSTVVRPDTLKWLQTSHQPGDWFEHEPAAYAGT